MIFCHKESTLHSFSFKMEFRPKLLFLLLVANFASSAFSAKVRCNNEEKAAKVLDDFNE